jgi:uncharacterized coiled-coil DUF342 family protein
MNDETISFESKIEELRKELDHFKEKRDGLNFEARRWAQERDRIHSNFKELLSKKSGAREKYGVINDRINILKKTMTEAREERRKKRVQLRILKGKLRDLTGKGSYARSENLKAKMEDIEWRIQTTPLQLEEEKRLVEEVRFLETQLAIDKQIEKLRDDESSLKDRMDAAYNGISELYEQKGKMREDMVQFSKKLDELKIKADEMHGKYLGYRDEAKKFHLRYVEILNQIRSLEGELDKMEEKRRAERSRELKKDLEKKALEKLSGRKRLTLEELKILAEKGKI